MTETDTKTPRVRRTPAQKATEALQAARARHGKAVENHNRLLDLAHAATEELEKAAAHLRYAEQHPDLPVQAFGALDPDDAVQVSDSFGVSRG